MKIAIVGAGNGGLIVALHLLREHHNTDVEIEIYYDPSIPIEKVGQGSLPNFTGIVSEVLDIDWYNNPIDATIKSGILYEGWGQKKDKFFHAFPMDFVATHYSPYKLREYMIEKNICKFIEQNVEDCNDIDADYVFDCRGTPKDLSQYNTIKNPLNSVILGQKNEVDHNQQWTRAVATLDGWTFVIPNKNYTSYGYLYNSNITSDYDARKSMHLAFDVLPETTVNFNNYVAKEPIQNDKVILNGNRLLFIEPLEASAVECYLRWTTLVSQWIFDGRSKSSILEQFSKDIFEHQNFILWHYANGSKYNTDFWQHAMDMSRNHVYDDRFFEYIEVAQSKSRIELIDETEEVTYGQWHNTTFKNWIDNVFPTA